MKEKASMMKTKKMGRLMNKGKKTTLGTNTKGTIG